MSIQERVKLARNLGHPDSDRFSSKVMTGAQVSEQTERTSPRHLLRKTTAYRRYKDDVPDQIKKERHNRMLEIYRRKCQILNDAEIGNTHLVLVEGTAKKSGNIIGRNELYMRVVFEQTDILTEDGGKRQVKPGDYVAVKIVGARSATLKGVPLYHTSLCDFYRGNQWGVRRAVN